MAGAAVQIDLFADPAPAVASAPPASSLERRIAAARAAPSAGQLEWIRHKIPVWLKRAALLREGRPQPEKGADWRASALESVVEGLALRASGGDRLAALKLQLEACQPYQHPTAEIVCHSGPVMAEIRARLEAAIAEAGASAQA